MNATEVLVPVALFTMIGTISVSAIFAAAAVRREANQTLRIAIEKGTSIDTDVLHAVARPMKLPEHDLRSGIILSALAGGLLAAGLTDLAAFMINVEGSNVEQVARIEGEVRDATGQGFFVAAVIVGALGIGHLISWFVRDRLQKADKADKAEKAS